jgi:hypothetical protein
MSRASVRDTARGMTVGNRSVVSDRKPWAVFISSQCDWLWSAKLLGFTPKLVHFRHPSSIVPLVQRLYPDAKVIVGSCAALPSFDLPRVAFVHGSAGAFSFLFDHVDVLVSTKGKRGKIPQGWRLSQTRVAHHAVGGVTDGVDHCFLWHRGPETHHTDEVGVPSALPRDVNSIVSDT